MAKANTYEWERGNFCNGNCDVEGCDNPTKHRLFYYPTVMNGDAEEVASLCNEHKHLKGHYQNKIKTT